MELVELQTMTLPNLHSAEALEEINKKELWLNKRKGKFTSSECHRLMTYENDIEKFPAGAETYIMEKVIEMLTTGNEESFSNEAMDWGNEKELEAISKFEARYNVLCYATGENQEFIQMCSYFGGTPDGFINEDRLIEVKCPNSKTHFSYLKNLKNANDLKKHSANYYWQIQGNLLATGRKKGYFISYDPRFIDENKQLLVVEIDRNEGDIEKLKKRLKMAQRRKLELLKSA